MKQISTASALAAAAGHTAVESEAVVKTEVQKTEGAVVAGAQGEVLQVQVNKDAKGATKATETKAEAKPKKAKGEGKASTKTENETKTEEAPKNAKKAFAEKIFDANKDKEAGAIAGEMVAKSKGMAHEMTYSNAYYYVTRVFGKKKKSK